VDPRTEFSTIVTSELKRRSLSQKWLAEKIGVSEPYMSLFLKGKRTPLMKHFTAISAAFVFSGSEQAAFERVAERMLRLEPVAKDNGASA
jgi:transcriptional regulator with XRE-family HTH domain